MNSLIMKMLPWILASLQCIHLSVALSCGKCFHGQTLLCPNYTNYQIAVTLEEYPDNAVQRLTIECSEEVNETYSLLEGCSFQSVTGVRFNYCPFSNESFFEIFQTIGVNPEKIDHLSVYYPLRNVTGVHSNHFRGLSNLTFLNLEFTELNEISENAFESNTNLMTLHLRGNNLHTLEKNTFRPLSKLTLLNLSHNNLSSIPEGLLDKLGNLKFLHFWYNNIESLPPNIFDHLESLQNLTLMTNKLTALNEDLFVKNSKLYYVNFKRNKLTRLPQGLFKNCSELRVVKFARNSIENIPESFLESNYKVIQAEFNENNFKTLPDHIFHNLTSLKMLNLAKNSLKLLPAKLFAENRNLTIIDFRHNLLSSLPFGLFDSTVNLQSLNLNNNSLVDLPQKIFYNCRSLVELYISKNKLSSLLLDSFPRNHKTSLKKVYFSYNNLTSEGVMSSNTFVLNLQLQLEIIDFSYNKFRFFPAEANLFNFLKLEYLNLEGNLIRDIFLDDILELPDNSKVNLKKNKIEKVTLSIRPRNNRVSVFLGKNNLTCDCNLYSLVNTIQSDKSHLSTLIYHPIDEDRGDSLLKKKQEESRSVIHVVDKDDLVCQRPVFLANQNLTHVNMFKLTCEVLATDCSPDCPCWYRPIDSMVTVDCSGRQMEHPPSVTYHSHVNYTLDLSSNRITGFNFSGESSIVNLTLSDNNLNFDNLNNKTVLPPKLKFLDLSRNNLTHIDQKFLTQFNLTGTEIDITHNPWVCDCAVRPLHNFIQAQFRKVRKFREVVCKEKNVPLMDLTEEDVCPLLLQPMVIITIGVITALLVLFAVFGTVSFYRYKTRIKVWLFTHKLCLWLVTEDEFDVDKQYDAFISYSHKDEEFVNDILVPGLENGDPKYRVCLHYRDWTVGEFIQNQILNSVQSSRRTVVVLSRNFIESVWGQMEFRAAHQQAMQDNTNRVLVIVYGEMPPEESLDDELRHYVALNTYLKWGDPRFWENLRYAMPHHRHPSKQRRKRQNTDKLELVNGHIKENAIRV